MRAMARRVVAERGSSTEKPPRLFHHPPLFCPQNTSAPRGPPCGSTGKRNVSPWASCPLGGPARPAPTVCERAERGRERGASPSPVLGQPPPPGRRPPPPPPPAVSLSLNEPPASARARYQCPSNNLSHHQRRHRPTVPLPRTTKHRAARDRDGERHRGRDPPPFSLHSSRNARVAHRRRGPARADPERPGGAHGAFPRQRRRIDRRQLRGASLLVGPWRRRSDSPFFSPSCSLHTKKTPQAPVVQPAVVCRAAAVDAPAVEAALAKEGAAHLNFQRGSVFKVRMARA